MLEQCAIAIAGPTSVDCVAKVTGYFPQYRLISRDFMHMLRSAQ